MAALLVPAAWASLMVYTFAKDMSEELKQFVSLTSATSEGCAKVMSTHFWEEGRLAGVSREEGEVGDMGKGG